MKVLLLHVEDAFSDFRSQYSWDLIVDLGRAPAATYEDWSRNAGCRVVSLCDFAAEIDDLYHVRQLLRLGLGYWVDRMGMDWWDLLSIMISDGLLQLLSINRLARELGTDCELYCTRPNLLAQALQRATGCRLSVLESGFQSVGRRVRHYSQALSQLDPPQLLQVLEDKFDSEHAIRRLLAPRRRSSGRPMVLLPSAYINVSRMEISYARLLPEVDFLLVRARRIGELKSVPAHVHMASLDSYATASDPREIASLRESWKPLYEILVSNSEEFAIAGAIGLLDRVPSLLPWGIAARNAWNQVFESENITGCLSADENNPYSNIPLVLAKQRGLAALACHHGAMDCRTALKTRYPCVYLAKSEMERDYLLRQCQLPPERIALGAPPPEPAAPEALGGAPEKAFFIFFSEPFAAAGWRSAEIYRDLLPRLCSLARVCRLRLIFKLHPFESAKGVRALLSSNLPSETERQIDVIKGPMSKELWRKTRFAMVVQSTVALECHALGVPVFLCSWLGGSHGAYVRQYRRFGIGQLLETPDQIADIPRLLETISSRHPTPGNSEHILTDEEFHQLLDGAPAKGAAVKGLP